ALTKEERARAKQNYQIALQRLEKFPKTDLKVAPIHSQSSTITKSLTAEEQARAEHNRQIALERQQKRSIISKLPRFDVSSKDLVDSKRSLTLESTLGDVRVSDTPNNQGLGQKSFSILNWNLLTSPGLLLRNEKNNCWYHATLHFLSVFPPFSESLNYNEQVSEFPRRFTDAISAIVRKQNLTPINHLFELIKDFQGVNNRYGQIAVPDFLEYLSTQ